MKLYLVCFFFIFCMFLGFQTNLWTWLGDKTFGHVQLVFIIGLVDLLASFLFFIFVCPNLDYFAFFDNIFQMMSIIVAAFLFVLAVFPFMTFWHTMGTAHCASLSSLFLLLITLLPAIACIIHANNFDPFLIFFHNANLLIDFLPYFSHFHQSSWASVLLTNKLHWHLSSQSFGDAFLNQAKCRKLLTLSLVIKMLATWILTRFFSLPFFHWKHGKDFAHDINFSSAMLIVSVFQDTLAAK